MSGSSNGVRWPAHIKNGILRRLLNHGVDIQQRCVLLAEGAECKVDGLALIADSQLADTHTLIDHARQHGQNSCRAIEKQQV